jgi:Domain of unknown function (DUF6438)
VEIFALRTAGKPAAAEVEEYLGLLPAERLPTSHVAPPLIRPNSEVAIILERTACFGTCPAYTVTVGTNGITFAGRAYVVASGTHTDSVDTDEVRTLAKRFLAADFYSMDSSYRASVTDSPTYVLSISIDGRKKEVEDPLWVRYITTLPPKATLIPFPRIQNLEPHCSSRLGAGHLCFDSANFFGFCTYAACAV